MAPADTDDTRPPTRTPPDPGATRRAQSAVATVAIALAVGNLGYRAVMEGGLDQTAALFVGLPAILAIAVAGTAPARTVTGLILKVMTLGLLLGGVMLGETLICLVVAAPLVYLVGIAVGLPIDASRRRRARGEPSRGPLLLVGVVLLFSVEGAMPGVAVEPNATVSVVRHVDAAPHAVAGALAATPRFDRALPLPLRIGFPRPVAAAGDGLHVGDRRRVTFVGDDHYGATHVGDLHLEVVGREPGRVVFDVVADDTRVAQWLRWQRADVSWTADGSGTRVSWTLYYERQLSPAWYFAPVQHGATWFAAGYLVDSLATPDG